MSRSRKATQPIAGGVGAPSRSWILRPSRVSPGAPDRPFRTQTSGRARRMPITARHGAQAHSARFCYRRRRIDPDDQSDDRLNVCVGHAGLRRHMIRSWRHRQTVPAAPNGADPPFIGRPLLLRCTRLPVVRVISVSKMWITRLYRPLDGVLFHTSEGDMEKLPQPNVHITT